MIYFFKYLGNNVALVFSNIEKIHDRFEWPMKAQNL